MCVEQKRVCEVMRIECNKCGLSYPEIEVRNGLCSSCAKGRNIHDRRQIEAIMLTTETAPNINITKRIEVITAECAFGMNIFKDLFAAVRDIVGGRSEAVQKTLRDSRKTVLYELKKEAYSVGANAVVGIDLDYMEMSSGGSMLLVVASGTAVIVEEV